ncbi:hypothetical protein DV735_g1854, partial [Chaetothyriales sp. CBS 134920]
MNWGSCRLLIIRVSFIVILLVVYFLPTSPINSLNGVSEPSHDESTSSYVPWRSSQPVDNLHDVQNQTLGFQEIRVISLPERKDKQDSWTVAASLTGFKYELADGVDSKRISNKSLPHTMDLPPKVIACWRAHMDVLQDMVNRGVSSMLVFEDDADWDVSLKSQLVQFARGTRWILNTTSTTRPSSPYGLGWDFLWIGHCGGNVLPASSRRFVIPHDPTVEPISLRTEPEQTLFQTWADAVPPDTQTRMVAPMLDGLCTASYAISLEGARKALYHMSMVPYSSPVDWGYGEMCREKYSGFTCIGPFPRIVGVYRAAGAASRGSDIESINDEISEAVSSGLVFSSKMNVDRLLRGERRMKSSDQVAAVTGQQEWDIDQIGAAVGYGETIGSELEYN